MSETPQKPKRKRATPDNVKINEIKLFHKNIIEGKTVAVCAKEMGISPRMVHVYKTHDDFRKMAIEHLENSKLKGLEGTVGKLVAAFDATRAVITQDADGSTHISRVPDEKTRMEALKEVIEIYGLHAPKRTDATITISFSSDEDLYRQIDEAQRNCRLVESIEKGPAGTGMAQGESGIGCGTIEARQRALLQDASLPEQV